MNPFKEIVEEKETKTNPFVTITEEPKKSFNPFLDITQQSEPTGTSEFTPVLNAVRTYGTEPAKKVGNITLDTISYLDRPAQALKIGAKDLIQAETEARVAGQIPPDKTSVFLEGAKKGLFGEERMSTGDVIPEDVKKEYPLLSGVAGFVGDVFTDPLTYVGPSVGKAAAESFKFGGRAIEKAAPALTDNNLLRAFNVYRGSLLKVRQLEMQYRDLAGAGKYQTIRESKEWNRRLNDLANELDTTPENLKASIVKQVEAPSMEAPLKIQQEAAAIRTKNASQIELEKQLGIKVGELENYFPHVPTPEALRALGKERIYEIFRKSELQHASTKSRKLTGTVEEINIGKPYGVKKFFTDDPVVAQAVRDVRHANSVASANFLYDAQRTFGITAEKAPGHFVETTIPILKGTKFEPDVAQYISKNYQYLNNPKEVTGFIELYDQAQNWWKMWSLGARPAYHIRNAVGNTWNNYLAGVKNPKVYLQAGQLEFMEQTGKFTGTIAGKPSFEVYDQALKHGVLGRSQYHGDIAENIIHEANRSLGKFQLKDFYTPSTKNAVLQFGFQSGRKIEENARLAHFIDRIRKGDDYETAAKSVKKYLFDYENLSPVEQKVFKRVMPFYTWTRKNIPLQIESFVEHPERFNRINQVIAQFQNPEDVPEDPNFIQETIRRQGPVYAGETPEGDKKAFTLEGYMPFMDVQKLAKPQEGLLGLISPFIKEPLEQIANYDNFRKEAIVKYKGQTTDFLGVKMPARLAHLARNVVMLNELDRANPLNIFGQNQIDEVTGERIQSRSFGMEEEIGAGQFGIGTNRESRLDMKGIDRILQYATGLKPVSVDEERGRAVFSIQLKKDIDTLRMYMRQAKRYGRERQAEEVEKAIEDLFGDLQNRNEEQ